MKNAEPATALSDLVVRLHDGNGRTSPTPTTLLQEQPQHRDGQKEHQQGTDHDAEQQCTRRDPEDSIPADSTLPRFPLLSFDNARETNMNENCVTNIISPSPPRPPSNDRPGRVSKELQGLIPGQPRPGAYEVVLRCVQNGIPTRRQDDVDDDGDQEEDVSNGELLASAEIIYNGSYPREELSVAAETINCDSDPNVMMWNQAYCFKPRCWMIVAASLLLLIATGIGAAFILTNADRDSSEAVEVSLCDYQEMAQPDIQRQCLCDGQITILSLDTLDRLDDIRAALGLITHADPHYNDDVSIKSCDPENQSLLLLATDDNVSLSDTEVLMNRYVLNVLYFSMDGNNWINNDGWMDTHDFCTPCCFYGVTCEGESVVAINLKGNGLFGSIPSQLGMLVSLKALDLSHNRNIVGELPASLGQLTNLRNMSVMHDSITGTITTDLGLLTDLEELHLGLNYLSGSIPEELASLTRLMYFDIGSNDINISGPVPMWIWQTASLRGLNLDDCGIEGSLPSQLGLLTSLSFLTLAGNSISGSMPSDIWRLTGLKSLKLASNSLVGTLSEAIANWSNLTFLTLTQNWFTGTIPNDALGGLKQLKEVNLAVNYLSGSIPGSDDTGLCSLRKNGILTLLVVDCGVDWSPVPDVVCDCCTHCFNKT